MTHDQRGAPDDGEIQGEEAESALVPLRNPDGSAVVSTAFLRRARVLSEAIFADLDGAPPAERLDWLMLEVEDFVARGGPQIRTTLSLAAFAVSVLAPLFIGRLTSLARLSIHERVRAVERLESSAIGSPVLAIKALLCVLYYEHPDAAAEVGFDGACLTGPRALGAGR